MIEETHASASDIFRLNSTDADGVTRRAKLEKMAARGKRPASLDAAIPYGALAEWALWLDMHQGRSVNGMGASPLSWLDIDAWSRMRGRNLTFTELELIRTIDRAFVEAQSQQEK